MKLGDLVRVKGCSPRLIGQGHLKCECFFCRGSSNRVGYIIGPGQRTSWIVMFDCGEWRLDEFDLARGDVEVISES